jgi:hypothetical protein
MIVRNFISLTTPPQLIKRQEIYTYMFKHGERGLATIHESIEAFVGMRADELHD